MLDLQDFIPGKKPVKLSGISEVKCREYNRIPRQHTLLRRGLHHVDVVYFLDGPIPRNPHIHKQIVVGEIPESQRTHPDHPMSVLHCYDWIHTLPFLGASKISTPCHITQILRFAHLPKMLSTLIGGMAVFATKTGVFPRILRVALVALAHATPKMR